MTVNEIISGLKFTLDMILFDPTTGETLTQPRNEMDITTVDACKGAIELLTELVPKTGQWISISYNAGPHVWKCNRCGNLQRINTNFCSDCGIKMTTESEKT